MRARAALLIAGLLAAGCSTRAHLNPFDPENPDTGGRPSGFVAIAGNQVVQLAWDRASAAGLAGYQVLRLAPGDSAYRPISDVLPPDLTGLLDTGLLNGADHRYRLYYVLTSGARGARSAEDVATPGPLRPWVADVGGTDLVRLSADGRHVAQRLGVAEGVFPAALDVDRTSGRVWVAGDGAVLVYEPWLSRQFVLQRGLGDVLESIAVDRAVPASAWVADASDGYVGHLRPDGSAADPPLLSGMQHPICVAVDAADGALWVADRDGDEVRRYTESGALAMRAGGLPRPHRLAVDPVTHRAWVTCPEAGRVFVIEAAGAVADSLTALRTPLAVAVDAARRRIWVSDFAAAAVVALDPAGAQVAACGGLSEPRRIAVDPATGEAWVTLGGTGSVVRLSPAGVLLRTVGGLGDPWDIALDDAGAHALATGAAAR